jgi:uncharacterized protein YgbK (DUF1537 family)
MPAPLLGWYGDDFTGATDTLAVLTQAGLRAMLFMGVPGGAQQAAAARALGGALHAVGIAGASRSMAPAAMEGELEPVGAFFATLGSRVLHYKVCSTFDSAPEAGSIGMAVGVLRRHVRHAFVPIVGGQPNLGRYCAFSNLFAAAGSGGVVERIDRHPTMRNHPMTPMKEADLRRHLALQGLQPVAGLHYPVYAETRGAQQDVLRRLLDETPAAVLLDITEPTQLVEIGRLIWQQAQQGPLLAVGPSGVAQALIAHWQESGQMPTAEPLARGEGQSLERADSPVFVFAGSLSPITARQVRGAKSFQQIALHAGALLDSPSYGARVQADIGGHLLEGRHVLAYTASANGEAPDTGKSAELAQATARCVKAIVDGQAMRGAPLRRMGIAGGDTSSLAVKALGVWGLSYRAALGAGVCVSTTHSDDPALDGMELMLKGGQMGTEDVFERLLGNPFALTTDSAA